AALVVPANITIIAVPPTCPELNPVENVWQFLLDNWLSNRIFKSYDDLVDIHQAVWLYVRFGLSYRDVEDMLAERGIDVSYETVRRWALKFGTIIARRLRRGRSRPSGRWHLDEVFVSINGRQLTSCVL